MRAVKRTGDLEAFRINVCALILPCIRVRREKDAREEAETRAGKTLRRLGIWLGTQAGMVWRISLRPGFFDSMARPFAKLRVSAPKNGKEEKGAAISLRTTW
jgi:hypothetical protein